MNIFVSQQSLMFFIFHVNICYIFFIKMCIFYNRERWEQEKHGTEHQEHDRTLERERREWEHHQQEARCDQQQRLQLEMHQRRELIVDESASSASDAVNQHFHESFLRLASQKVRFWSLVFVSVIDHPVEFEGFFYVHLVTL